MKIKEFLITRYGPLKNEKPFQLKNFNLFWGKNENGKTLTIDALVKLLLGRNIRNFENIDRVGENPEGYVIVEDDKGKEIKLPEKGDLTKVAGLTSSECRNIFIIRNSDLSVVREGEFYTDVTDRLTGLRTKEISDIKKALFKIGRITESGKFRDEKGEKLKTRIENAKSLVRKIEGLVEKIKEEGFDRIEEKSVRCKEEIRKIEQRLKSLEDARKREKYERGKESLDKLKESLDKLSGLEIYNEEDEQLWRNCERDIEIFSKEREEILAELKKYEDELKDTSEKLSEIESDFRVFDERKKKLDDEVRPELKTYEREIAELSQQESRDKFFVLMLIISVILLAMSLVGAIVSPSLFWYIFAGLFFIAVVISGTFKFRLVRYKAWLRGMFERIKLNLSKFELDAEDIEGILSNIQKFDEEYQKKNERLQDVKRKKEKLQEKVKELQDEKIPDIESKIKDAEDEIARIKAKSGAESLEDYSSNLKLKREVENTISQQEKVLESHFEKKSDKLEENILYWEKEIKNLEEYKDKARNVKYSEKDVSELKKKKTTYEEELKDINDKMVSLQKEMEEVQGKVNEILQLEDGLYCKTLVDLERVKNELKGFIYENENNRDNVLKVIGIFEKIEAEEKEKVSELFGKESPVSEFFREITDGLYEEVAFNQENGKIEVKRKDGVILEAEKLSGGAYDQLYFSIRLALGEKLLKGKKGFFIMDDPFIKADPDRLQRQIEMLKKISDFGWQIIYFSAKGEIKDVFKEDIEKGAINCVEVQGIFS